MVKELIHASASADNVTAQIDHIRDAAKRLTSMVDNLISDAMADALDITILARAGRSGHLWSTWWPRPRNQPLAAKERTGHYSVGTGRPHGAMCDADRHPRGHR